MRKLAIFSAIVILVYTAVWFGISYLLKTNIINPIISDKNSVFTAEKAHISGFPFKFTIDFERPRLQVEDEVETSDKNLTIERNILGNRYDLIMRQVNLEKAGIRCDYAATPTIFHFDDVFILERIWLKNKNISMEEWFFSPDLWNKFSSFSINNASGICYDRAGQKISDTNNFNANFVRDVLEERFLYKISYSFGASFLASQNNFVNVDSSLNAELDMGKIKEGNQYPSDAKLKIADLSLKGQDIGLNITGDVAYNEADIVPFGALKITINQYQNLEKYGLPHEIISKYGEASSDGKNLLISISRAQGGKLYIGKEIWEF